MASQGQKWTQTLKYLPHNFLFLLYLHDPIEQTTNIELSLGDFDAQTYVPFISGFHGVQFNHDKGVMEILNGVKAAAKKHFPASRNQIELKKEKNDQMTNVVRFLILLMPFLSFWV